MSVSTFSPSSTCTNTESSLNLHNLNTALETLPDEEWDDFGMWMNVPGSQRTKIRSQYSTKRERKSALLHTYLTSYPAPSWQHVADILYRCGWGKFHAVLEKVQTMFPTGKKMCQCCVVLLTRVQESCCYCVDILVSAMCDLFGQKLEHCFQDFWSSKRFLVVCINWRPQEVLFK